MWALALRPCTTVTPTIFLALLLFLATMAPEPLDGLRAQEARSTPDGSLGLPIPGP